MWRLLWCLMLECTHFDLNIEFLNDVKMSQGDTSTKKVENTWVKI